MNHQVEMKRHEYFCGACDNWAIAAGDLFCGWCGARLFGFDCTLSPEAIFADGEETDKREIDLRIENIGRRPIKILEVSTDRQDLVTVSGPPSLQAPIMISPEGGVHLVKLVVDLTGFQQERREIQVRIRADYKGDAGVQTRLLHLLPMPEFAVHAEALRLDLDGDNLEKNFIQLSIKKGWVEIDEISTDRAWAAISAPELKARTVMSLEEQPDLRLQLHISEKLLIDEIRSGGIEGSPVKLQLVVRVKGLETRPFKFEIAIQAKLPPTLVVKSIDNKILAAAAPYKGAIVHEVFKGARRERFDIPLVIENRGDMDLHLHEISLASKPSWGELTNVHSLPEPIAKSGTHNLILRVAAAKIPEGEHALELVMRCNDPGVENGVARFLILIKALVLQPYPGIVAVDFGTTNTCVAVFNPKAGMEEPEVISLESLVRSSDDSSIPSVILYDRMTVHGQREYKVGYEAKSRIGHRETEESIIRSIKRKLGEQKALLVRFAQQQAVTAELRPEEIAGDIIGTILEELEIRLKHKVNSCVISHPVHFLHRRLETLERAFKNAGVAIEAKLSEPLAAAIDYILQHTDIADSYTLLVWDFGGGTTDIAYLQVTVQTDEEGRKQIVPELLGADGDRWFGGDNITGLLMQHFAQICETELKKKQQNPATKILIDREAIAQIPDEQARRAAQSNYFRLFDLAEDAKIRVSTTAEAWQSSLTLRPWQKSEAAHLFSLRLDLETLNRLTGPPIEEAMSYMADLIERCGNRRPDKVLLTGNSSRLPIVNKLMQEALGRHGSDIIGAGNQEEGTTSRYKESVAIGLCQYRILSKELSSVIFGKLLGKPVATTNIGIRKANGRATFEPIIKKGNFLDQWYQVKGVYLSPTTIPAILSCADRSNRLNGNPYLETIAEFPLDKLDKTLREEDFRKAKLFLQVTSEGKVLFKIAIDGREHQFHAALPAEAW